MGEIIFVPRLSAKSRLLVASSSQYFNLSSGPSPGSGGFTVGGWMLLIDSGASYYLSSTGAGNATSNGWRVWVNTNRRMRASIGDGTVSVDTPDSGTQMAVGVWNHLVAVRDTSVTPALLRCYLNGSQVSSVDASTVGSIGTGDATSRKIGAFTASLGLANARITRAFYSNQVLDATDVAALISGAPTYERLPLAQQSKMVHFWNLNAPGNAVDSLGLNDGIEINGPIAVAQGPRRTGVV